MEETFKFPNDGYDVKIIRKEEILKCIDDNVIDKEIALALIRRCELDASNFIRQGRWTAIPFMGNIKIKDTAKIFRSVEHRAIMEEAKANLDRDKYILFRNAQNADVGRRVRQEKYYKYIVSRFVGKNYKFFKRVAAERGDVYARFLCYTCNVLLYNKHHE